MMLTSSMLQRTTISLDRKYLDFLKLLAVQKQKKLSELVNDAVRIYLSSVSLEENNVNFFNNLNELKEKLNLSKSDLTKYIQKGRL